MTESGQKTNVILGAGLAGLSAAHHLKAAGQGDAWRVFERNDRVGGLARSKEVEGYLFDYGPHILFTIDDEMEALIRDLLGDNFHAQEREAWIYHASSDLYTRFPFQAHLYGLPVPVVRDCLVGLVEAVEAQARGEFHPTNYVEWMRGFFGEGIAEHLMIPYAKKIWKVEPSTMDFNWIGRRVPTPQVERIVSGALTDDVEQVGATAKFWYPKTGGIEPLPKALGERVSDMVELGRTAVAIDAPGRTVRFDDGEVVAYESLVYTLPLPKVPEMVRGVPDSVVEACRGLRYQGIYCVNVGVDRGQVSDKHWVYFYEDQFPFHRLSFPANFAPDTVPPGKSSIATEVAFSDEMPLTREEAEEKTIAGLLAAGILESEEEIDLVHTECIHPAYVIYDLAHGDNVATIRDWLRTQDIHTAGRFGEWQYFNMDHSMRSGKHAADAILTDR